MSLEDDMHGMTKAMLSGFTDEQLAELGGFIAAEQGRRKAAEARVSAVAPPQVQGEVRGSRDLERFL